MRPSSPAGRWRGGICTVMVRPSFIGTSIFALTGILLHDPLIGVGELLQVIVVALVWDVALTPFVLPGLMGLFTRLEPDRVGV